ncbi:MAG: hypothetical protein MMC33_008588 [Icmadophila ericetorum]|nr:hypothetical protein [Icmadophila ericetorum]
MANAGDDSAANLSSLFANLKPSGRAPSVPYTQGSPSQSNENRQSNPFDFTTYATSTRSPEGVSSNVLTSDHPQPFNGSQTHLPTVMNTRAKSATPQPTAEQTPSGHTNSLLSLLKFTKPSQNPPTPPHSSAPPPKPHYGATQGTQSPGNLTMHGRRISASDLVPSLSPRPQTNPSGGSLNGTPSLSRATTESGVTTIAHQQDYLLRLSNRKPAQDTAGSTSGDADVSKAKNRSPVEPPIDEPVSQVENDFTGGTAQKELIQRLTSPQEAPPKRNDSPIRIFGSNDGKEPTPFDPQDIPKSEPSKESIFTYVNPFEQLAASSPRKVKTKPATAKSAANKTNGEGHKRKSNEPSPAPSHPASRRRLTPGGSDILQSIEGDQTVSEGDTKSQHEALGKLGAPTTDTETVADALNEVGAVVSKQVDVALAQAKTSNDRVGAKDEALEKTDEEPEAVLEILEERLQKTAIEVKKELEAEPNKGVLESIMPEPAAQVVKDIINQAARGNVDDHYEEDENVERSLVRQGDGSSVYVYNFPLKPFVSIDLKQDKLPTRSFHEDTVVEIARLKKEFDQTDRTLTTASSDYIIYAMPKNGGVRIIRQDDGHDKQVFRDTRDRIFNASVSTAPPTSQLYGTQTLIATAVSGSVYWTVISKSDENGVKFESIETNGLTFPPVPTHDDNTSGGQLKTRAKKSSRHPEFFAIGRGKSIQIIFPFHAKSSNLTISPSVIDSEKYFRDRSLKINTGKAGKDFTFSEDDTVIVTLDKAGRLRLWDIRDLINESNGIASKIAPIEVKSPILTFPTTVPSEKSWPTSVLFVDKLRPYTKGIALRYVIVGMKQNHTLQLWDLGLGKAVQELNFPHEKESDAICSVCYHPSSGIIVVGHPTRNSIYFIHLSAPKYNLPSMSQAAFVQRLANKDSTLPKPESTAIMSGMREYSFLSKGQLRSVDLLPMSQERALGEPSDESPLFELYMMHSKGVTCLSIKREDLGWSVDNKVLHPVDAEDAGLVIVKDLKEPQSRPFSEPSSVNGDAASTTASLSSKSRDAAKASITSAYKELSDVKLADAEASNAIVGLNGPSSIDKSDKKKKKKFGDSGIPPPAPVVPDTYANAAQRAHTPVGQAGTVATESSKLPTKSRTTNNPDPVPALSDNKVKRPAPDAQVSTPGLPEAFFEKGLEEIEKTMSAVFSKALSQELDSFHRRLDDDKRVQDAAGAAKQEAILRLISSTLTDNVDKALSRHISTSIQEVVLPAISNVTASALNKKISEVLTEQLQRTLPVQLKAALPEAVNRIVQSPAMLKHVSEQVTSKVASNVEKGFAALMQSNITPAFQNLAISTAHKMSAETERRIAEQLENAENQRRLETAKLTTTLEQLTALIQAQSETIHTMAAAQFDFQAEILRLQQDQQDFQLRVNSTMAATGQTQEPEELLSGPLEPEASPEQDDLARIDQLMSTGKLEEGTIAWVQSLYQAELFDKFFVHFSTDLLQQCQTIVKLSVGAAVTVSFEKNMTKRLEWLETVINSFDPHDPDIRDVTPRIMGVLRQRLETQYMNIAEQNPQDPVLRRIPPLTARVREIASLHSSMA